MKTIIFFCLLTLASYPQSNLDKVIKSGEILINGLTILKDSKSNVKSIDSDIIERICVKNKLTDKITLNIAGKDDKGNSINKSLVIQKDGKECLLDVPKGIYSYEIIRSDNQVYKKGEYKFESETTITVKD